MPHTAFHFSFEQFMSLKGCSFNKYIQKLFRRIKNKEARHYHPIVDIKKEHFNKNKICSLLYFFSENKQFINKHMIEFSLQKFSE